MLWWVACTSDTTAFGTGGHGTGCPDGLEDCSGYCVNIDQNPSHCGACDQACEAGQLCAAGSCVSPCEAGEIPCDGACVDPASDARHCGGCGQACDEHAECDNYQCRCFDGRMDCDGECVLLMSDHEHCGQCHEPCGATEVCSSGQCVSTCGNGELDCGGSCVDVSTSVEHCGGCDQPCNVATEICDNGTCTCPGGSCGACDIVDLGSAVPQTITGNTTGAVDELPSWCAAGGPDDVYRFTAPATNTYVFSAHDTTGSYVLSIRSEACANIACEHEYGPTAPEVDLAAGESVLVAIEGYDDTTVAYELRIQAWPSCPETALGSQVPQTVADSTLGGLDTQVVSCILQGGHDHTYSFTAPATEDYLFVLGGSIEPYLEVRDATCNGPVLDCVTIEYPAQYDVATLLPLAQGQPVVLVVDSGAMPGPYTLSVQEAPGCPEQDLGSVVPQIVPASLIGTTHLAAPNTNCFVPGMARTTFGFTAPTTGSYGFDASLLDRSIEVIDGDCLGASLGCLMGQPSGGPLVVQLVQGQQVVVIVGSHSPPEDFDLSVTAGPPCPNDDLGSTSPQSVAGDTSGLLSLVHPSCAAGVLAPDYSYAFTAPVAGAYTFETDTSLFDPVLHVRDQSCAGAELACDDNSGVGDNAQLTVVLSQDQPVVITVDGRWSAESGAYQLHVSGP